MNGCTSTCMYGYIRVRVQYIAEQFQLFSNLKLFNLCIDSFPLLLVSNVNVSNFIKMPQSFLACLAMIYALCLWLSLIYRIFTHSLSQREPNNKLNIRLHGTINLPNYTVISLYVVQFVIWSALR